MVHGTDIVVTMKANRKSCIAYRMTQIPVTLSEFEGHWVTWLFGSVRGWDLWFSL